MTNFNFTPVNVLDDQTLFINRRDYSGGINTVMHPQHILENQATVLTNVDLSVAGERAKRKGSSGIADDVGNNPCKVGHNFVIQGETDQMLMIEGTTLWSWLGTGNWSSVKADFTDTTYASIISVKESGLAPDDVVMVQNGTDNAFRIDSDGNAQDLGSTAGTGTDSPPKSLVNVWYGNRWWILKDDQFYFSAAYSADYSGAFDTPTDVFRIPVGEEMAAIPTRDFGMVIFGREAVWAFNPSVVPVATDQPVPITTSVGCVARNSVINVADDIYWLAQDGVRTLKRTEQDKMQMHASFPASYPNKDEYDLINWAYVDKSTSVYFDNKYMIALPTSSSTTNNKVWVYYPATGGWSTITGWNVGDWVKYKVNGEERLYYVDATDGQAYQVFTGYSDDGVAIAYTEEGREEDMGQPLITKIGGTIEVQALAAGGTYNLTVYASIDGGAYSQLGVIVLYSDSAPILPVSLPFTLGGVVTVREKFHLDSLGAFRTIKIKITNTDVNTDQIKIFGHSITANPEEFEDE